MIPVLLSRFASQLAYLEALIADIPEERMAEQPAPGVNSPAWLLGHLVWAADFVPGLLGLAPAHGEEWAILYGARSKPIADRSLYGSKADLISALRQAHTRTAESMHLVTPETLAAELPDPAFRAILPTVGDAIVHILTTHEGTHIGQLSAWRRVVGLPPWKVNMFAV